MGLCRRVLQASVSNVCVCVCVMWQKIIILHFLETSFKRKENLHKIPEYTWTAQMLLVKAQAN